MILSDCELCANLCIKMSNLYLNSWIFISPRSQCGIHYKMISTFSLLESETTLVLLFTCLSNRIMSFKHQSGVLFDSCYYVVSKNGIKVSQDFCIYFWKKKSSHSCPSRRYNFWNFSLSCSIYAFTRNSNFLKKFSFIFIQKFSSWCKLNIFTQVVLDFLWFLSF